MARRRYARPGEPFKHDPSPEFACEVTKDGRIRSWMAFDPRYGPENEEQIEWHRRKGTPGAQNFKVGVPCKIPARA